jgi:hypothetical protein
MVSSWRTAVHTALNTLPWYCHDRPNIYDTIKEDTMGWACGTYGTDDKFILDFGGETCRKDAILIELGISGVIFKWTLEK